LEGSEEGGNRGEGWRSRSNYSGRFDIDEICVFQFFSCDRVFVMLRNIGLDQTLLEDVAGLRRDHRLLWRLARNCKISRISIKMQRLSYWSRAFLKMCG
jgi:hypothetical protein